jgi:hypothetical protein
MSPGAFALANQLSLTSKELVRCILGRRRTISILQSSAARSAMMGIASALH